MSRSSFAFFNVLGEKIMGAMSISHWLIVGLVVALLFGPKKLGSLGQSLGEGIRGFREGVNDKPRTPAALPPGKQEEKAEEV